jgi:transposase-like protein
MVGRRKFSAEYKREAVAMLDAPGVTVSQIAADLGIGANMLGRWRRASCARSPSRPLCATDDPGMKR